MREFALIALGQGGVALGGIVGVRLLTQALGPTIYGEIALGMTLVLLAQQMLLSPLSVAFLRFFSPAKESRTVHAYANAVRRLLLQASAVVGILAMACTLCVVALGHAERVGVILAASTLSLLYGYNGALDNIQHAARHRMLSVSHQIANQWGRFIVALALIAMFEKSSAIVLAAYALVSAVALCSRMLFLGKKLEALAKCEGDLSRNTQEIVTRMRYYALPFATWGVFTWAFEASGRWALQFSSGTTDVGLYAALCQIGQYPIVLISDAIATTVAPIVFARAGDGSDRLRLREAQRMNAFVVIGMFLIAAAASVVGYQFQDRIVALVVGPEYYAIAPLLPWTILAGGLFGCAQVATLRVLMTTDTRVLIMPKICTAILGIVLKVGGAYLIGLHGVVVASVIFSILYWVWLIVMSRERADHSVLRDGSRRREFGARGMMRQGLGMRSAGVDE